MLDFQLAVIGLGAMGSATLYQLAKRGIDVVGIDRFDPPHAEGSSHGDTRITRLGVGEGGAYVPLVARSHAIWRELEKETGNELLTQCGTLIIAPADMPNSHHGKRDFLGRTIRTSKAFGIEHELLDAAQIKARFPQYGNLTGGEHGYFEPAGGYVCPERCIESQLLRARELGAQTMVNTEVVALSQHQNHVRIETSTGAVTASQVIATVGPWTVPLLGHPFDKLLTVRRQVLHWFELNDQGAAAGNWPVAIWMHGSQDTDYFYSFPPMPGENSIKVATEQYQYATTADTVSREVTGAESAEMYKNHVAGRIPGASSQVVKTAACVYTVSLDLDFIIDRHPEMPGVSVVSACSGHGFKHSAGIGEVVADRVVCGKSDVDMSAFELSRFAASLNIR